MESLRISNHSKAETGTWRTTKEQHKKHTTHTFIRPSILGSFVSTCLGSQWSQFNYREEWEAGQTGSCMDELHPMFHLLWLINSLLSVTPHKRTCSQSHQCFPNGQGQHSQTSRQPFHSIWNHWPWSHLLSLIIAWLPTLCMQSFGRTAYPSIHQQILNCVCFPCLSFCSSTHIFFLFFHVSQSKLQMSVHFFTFIYLFIWQAEW